jgi:tetratricopeptide (TPR) repeat protein
MRDNIGGIGILRRIMLRPFGTVQSRSRKPSPAAVAVLLAALVLLSLSLGGCAQTQEFYAKRGDELLLKGEYTAALAQFKLALEAGRPSHRLYQAMSEAHAWLGETDEAIDNLLKAADILKKDALQISKQARAARRNPEEQERLLYLLEQRINPIHSQIYSRLGTLYIDKKDHATAVVAFKLALERDEKNLRARMELAQLMERKGDTESALKEWRRFVKDAEKASGDDRILYGIEKSDVISARGHVARLALKRGGAGTTGNEEK